MGSVHVRTRPTQKRIRNELPMISGTGEPGSGPPVALPPHVQAATARLYCDSSLGRANRAANYCRRGRGTAAACAPGPSLSSFSCQSFVSVPQWVSSAPEPRKRDQGPPAHDAIGRICTAVGDRRWLPCFSVRPRVFSVLRLPL